MYNQWQLQQIAAIQLAALHNQLMAQNLGPQQMQLPPQQQFNNSDDDDDDDDDEDDESERTLFCGNLDEHVTEELLYEIFLQVGPIESVRIPKDNVGRQRNFGFIVYVHQCSAPYATKLFQGLTLFRRTVNIKFQGRMPQNPSDVEVYRHNRRSASNNSSNNSSFDNSTLRISRVNTASPPMSSLNPFKRNDVAESLLGARISKHSSSQMRPHQNAMPYQRRSGGADRGHDHGRDLHGHNRGNRRSEQRKNDRR